MFDERQRPQATATLQTVFILGIVGGSVGLGQMIDPYSPDRLVAVVIGAGVLAVVLAVLGCLGVEPTGQSVETISRRVREVSFVPTLKLTFQNPQVRLFFLFLGVVLVATLSQDIFLEPYGAKLFNMSVGQTARLSMYWGIGTLGAMMLCGVWLVNRLGRKRVTAAGLAPMSANVIFEDSTCQAHRPSPLGEWGWFFDCSNGSRTDLLDGNGQTFFSCGANNLAPAFRQGADMEGLLAFQRDLDGSMDLYLAQIVGAGESNEVRGVFRLTTAAGWEGSPAWIP